MSNKLKFIFLLAALLCSFTVSVIGQQTSSQIEEIKKQTEQRKKLNDAKEELLKEIERSRELEKRERELQRTSTNDEEPRNANSDDGTTAKPQNPPANRTDTPTDTPTDNDTNTDTPPPDTPDQPDGNTAQAIDCSKVKVSEFDASRLDGAVCDIISRINGQNINGTPINQLSLRNTQEQILRVLAAKLADDSLAKSFFLESERQRTDKQVGSSPEKSGTTSLVVKGGTPALIGWAIEQGAATSSISGNTVTIRANPFNLAKALYYRQGILPIVDVDKNDSEIQKFLRKLSVGVSFDTTRGTEPDMPMFTANRQQISGFSVRYEFINHRNPLAPRHKELRDGFFVSQTGNLDKITEAVFRLRDRSTATFINPKLNEWLDETNVELNKIPITLIGNARLIRITEIIESQVEKLPVETLSEDAEIKEIVKLYTAGAMGFKSATDELLEDLSDGQIMTFEYTNNREPVKPDTSNFRFIWEKGVLGNTDLTFNASLTMYNRKPDVLNISRLRDFQFALQTDTKMGDPFNTGDFLVSFAGRYERLNTDTFNEMNMLVPGTKGDIAFGQIKLTIPIADLGIKFPFSVTFANRTDLIKESHVRANFGFTFDLDPLFARGRLF